MKKSLVAIFLLACALAIPSLAAAAQIRAYVAEFTVTPPETAGLKSTLQVLLSSRLASEAIMPVASPSDADVVITPSFTQIGKMFSLDAAAKLPSGKLVTSAFEQGESQDDLIPALGRISGKLKAEIAQRYPQAIQQQAAPAAPAAVQVASGQAAGQLGSTVFLSQRLTGAQIGIAAARTLPEEREIFLADSHTVRLYRQEKTLKLLGEFQTPLREKIIAVDSIGPDKNGNPRAYVTIMDGEAPSSKILSFQNGALKEAAGKLPYLFRAIGLNGAAPKVYAQEVSITEDFYGDLYEMPADGATADKSRAIKLPRYANIFNYNTISGPDGKSYATVFSPDGYLVVFSMDGEELWRSADKFGGSETYFQRESGASLKQTYEKYRWRFIDQRITTTPDGQLIVPQNAGFFVLGNNRYYSNYTMFSFTWNGSSLEERWRTNKSQNYLADYFYEPKTKELALLEVVQKEGAFAKGATAVRVIKAQ